MKFWAVWRTNGDYFLAPKHATKDAAVEEAVRLCELEDKTYHVMELVGSVSRRMLGDPRETKTIYSCPKELSSPEWESKVLP